MKIVYLFLFLFVSKILISESNLLKEHLIEDFESISVDSKNIRIRDYSIEIPEVKTSSLITSPDIVSNQSLLLRIKHTKPKSAFELYFPKKYVIDDFVQSFNIRLYSTNFSGKLYLIVKDSEFTAHNLLVGNLNFTGWKKIELLVPNKFIQKDWIINQKTFVQILGFYYVSESDKVDSRENIFVIDDIFAITRKKYLLLEN